MKYISVLVAGRILFTFFFLRASVCLCLFQALRDRIFEQHFLAIEMASVYACLLCISGGGQFVMEGRGDDECVKLE